MQLNLSRLNTTQASLLLTHILFPFIIIKYMVFLLLPLLLMLIPEIILDDYGI